MHRHRILALVGHFLGSRFSIWASGFLILLCFKWWRPVRTTNLLVGPCSALALVFYLIPSDIATIAMSLILPAKWVVHFFGFYPLGPIFLVKSCVMWPRTVLYHETCEDLFRWLILLRAACSETSVILCKRRTALDEMLLLLKMQNKMIVNLSMESSLLYNEIWSINPLNHIFQVSRKPSCHTAASKSLNKSCAPTHPRPPSSTFPLHAQVTAPYPGFADWADQNSTATQLDSKFPAAAHVHNASTWRVTCFCASFSFNSSCSTRSLLARPACRSSWPSDFASLSESMAMYALVCSCQLLSICCSFSYLQPQTESGRCVQYAQMVWRCLNSNGITLQSIAHLEWFHLQSCSEVMSFQSWHDGLFFIAKILFSSLWHTNSTLLSDSEILKLKQLQLHCMFVMLYASYFRTHKRHKKLPSGSCL